jgi:hypothetical protein
LVDPLTLHNNCFKKIVETPTYQQIDGVWTQVWEIVDRSSEEKEQILVNTWNLFASLKAPFADNFSSYVFDPCRKGYVAPMQKPDDGREYRWHGASSAWKEASPKPTDDKKYIFNFYTWEWVEEV